MKYVINQLCSIIGEQLNKSDSKITVRIDGFEDLRIYEAVCQKIKQTCILQSIKFVAKLSLGKFNYFKEQIHPQYQSALQVMEPEWIDYNDHLTNYRNLQPKNNEKLLVLLMGTEVVQDKGGLEDFYAIDPIRLDAELRGNYAQVFDAISWAEEERKIINTLYADLFSIVPSNIYRLSCMADEWEDVDNIDELKNRYYSSLPNWGIPKLIDHQPKLSGNRKLLQTMHSFITRNAFKKLSKPQYSKIITQIVEYDIQEKNYSSAWSGWAQQKISSYDSFKILLEGFVLGKQVDKNREVLLQTDYSIVNDILNLKLSKTSSPRIDKIEKIYDMPLTAFLRAVFISLADCDNELVDDVHDVEFNFDGAELINAIDPTDNASENEQLTKKWEKICQIAGGVLNFIFEGSWNQSEREFKLLCTPSDFLSPTAAVDHVEAMRIKAVGNSKLNKVSFSIKLWDSQREKCCKKEFIWCFADDDAWLLMFKNIEDNFSGTLWEDTEFIMPFGVCSDIEQFVQAKSSEEFFDLLENTSVEYNCDHDVICCAQKKANKFGGNEWVAEFVNMGINFAEFCHSIHNNGFYQDITEPSLSKLLRVVNNYCMVGRKLTSTALPANAKWALTLFIHAFCIEQNNFAILNEEKAESAMVPPWHPVVLEKLHDKMIFIRDGCKQWWEKNAERISEVSRIEIDVLLNELSQLTTLHDAIDLFPTKGGNYYECLHSFGGYCIYGKLDINKALRTRDIIKKEAVFDEDFKEKEFTVLDAEAEMIYGVIEKYVQAFPQSAQTIDLTFIDPDELQPIVAALHKYITEQKKNHIDGNEHNATISLKVNILVSPQNKGGRNYLMYWVNSFFSQDEDVDIRIFLNEWHDEQDICSYIENTVDIVFLMKVLNLEKFDFIYADMGIKSMAGCRYPIVYKPAPVSSTDVNRKLELTQTQFSTATVYSKVVYYQNNSNADLSKDVIIMKEVVVDESRRNLIYRLHQKACWVICIDGVMDGALLRSDSKYQQDYNIIGFSTGKGSHGQYNLTITARTAIIEAIRKRFENRLRSLFKWEENMVKDAAEFCIRQAGKLDGISLLSSLNPNDYKINEFMAYVITASYLGEDAEPCALEVLVHLDSYMHWFDKSSTIYAENSGSKSRPDFLHLTAHIGENGKINIKAKVIECKTARYENASVHIANALGQVEQGIGVLKELFDPLSDSIRCRYWYAQLYRALSFSQITFHDNTPEYSKFASCLRQIIEGQFTIEWEACVFGYWFDKLGEDVEIEYMNISPSQAVEIHSVPQKVIQNILLGRDFSTPIEYLPNIGPISPQDIQVNDEVDDEGIIENEMLDDDPRTSKGKITLSEESDDIVRDGLIVQVSDSDDMKPNLQVIEDAKKIIDENSSIETALLESIKVLIGSDRAGNKIYWDFGHKQLSNRHLLITGRSGQGKTYAIQTMLQELSLQGIPSVVFDYTEGFMREHLEPEFISTLGEKIKEQIVYVQGIPINPFRRQEVEIGSMVFPEKIVDVAQRIANIFANVYKFGDQQKAALYEACRSGIEQHGSKMDFSILRKELADIGSSYAKSVLSKIAPFLDCEIFDVKDNFDWNQVTQSEGTVMIFQLTNFVSDIQVIITELMLWDAWHYNKKYGNKNKPFVVVLDEAQVLSHKAESPSAMILTQGRKFGWSAWFATQFMKAQLSDSEVNRLQQAAFRIYFKPTDDEVTSIAKQLDPINCNASTWVGSLKSLQKGQCIVAGERSKPAGGFGPANPVITKILSFAERGNEN